MVEFVENRGGLTNQVHELAGERRHCDARDNLVADDQLVLSSVACAAQSMRDVDLWLSKT